MIKLLKKFAKDESGAAIVEYGLALMVVAAIGATAFDTLGGYVSDNVDAACAAMTVEEGVTTC